MTITTQVLRRLNFYTCLIFSDSNKVTFKHDRYLVDTHKPSSKGKHTVRQSGPQYGSHRNLHPTVTSSAPQRSIEIYTVSTILARFLDAFGTSSPLTNYSDSLLGNYHVITIFILYLLQPPAEKIVHQLEMIKLLPQIPRLLVRILIIDYWRSLYICF